MCLMICLKKGRKRKPLVAKKDITVYKTLTSSGFGPYYRMRINGKYEPYKPGYMYFETTPFENVTMGMNVFFIQGNCFHSCSTKNGASRYRNQGLTGHSDHIVKMVIPKGAKYYKSGGEYASSQIIYY